MKSINQILRLLIIVLSLASSNSYLCYLNNFNWRKRERVELITKDSKEEKKYRFVLGIFYCRNRSFNNIRKHFIASEKKWNQQLKIKFKALFLQFINSIKETQLEINLFPKLLNQESLSDLSFKHSLRIIR